MKVNFKDFLAGVFVGGTIVASKKTIKKGIDLAVGYVESKFSGKKKEDENPSEEFEDVTNDSKPRNNNGNWHGNGQNNRK